MAFLSYVPSNFISIFVLIGVGLIIYANSLLSPFQFDDLPFIQYNARIQDLKNIPLIWQTHGARPVGSFSFALNYFFGKDNVVGYHIINIFIHILASVMVWWLAQMTLTTRKFKDSPLIKDKNWVALASALIFLVHPVQTTAVNHITQRYTSLASLFYLMSLSVYAYARLGEKREFYFLGAAVLAILGMYTKEIVVTLPFMIVLYEMIFLEEKGWKGILKGRISLILFLLLLSFLIIVPSFHSFNWEGIFFSKIKSQSHTGDIITSWNYFLTQSRVIVTYIKLLFFPASLNFDYDFAVSGRFLETATFLSFLTLGALFLYAFKIYSRNPLVSFGIFWFFLTLLVESSIIPIPYVIAEYRIYLPMAGFSLALSAGLYFLIKSFKIFISIILAIVFMFSYLTFQRNIIWQNEITFWQDAVRKSPNKPRPYLNLGASYMLYNDTARALPLFFKVIELDPAFTKAYYNIASIHSQKRQFKEALGYALKAKEINPADADNVRLLYYLYFQMNDFDNAMQYGKELISVDQSSPTINDYTKMVINYFLKTKDLPKALSYADILRRYDLSLVADELEKLIHELQTYGP